MANKKIPWTDEELRLTLGYYFFIDTHNTTKHERTKKHDREIFAINLRNLTGNSRTTASVVIRLSNFISVDPSVSTKRGLQVEIQDASLFGMHALMLTTLQSNLSSSNLCLLFKNTGIVTKFIHHL